MTSKLLVVNSGRYSGPRCFKLDANSGHHKDDAAPRAGGPVWPVAPPMGQNPQLAWSRPPSSSGAASWALRAGALVPSHTPSRASFLAIVML
jgi:hypothetical protein